MKFKKALMINISENGLGDNYWKKLDELVDTKVSLPKDDPKIREELKDTDCLLVNFGIPVSKEDIDAATNLKYIGTLSTAFGKVDVDYAKTRGIKVCNLAGYSTESVAEFTIATILEAVRGLEEGKRRGRKGNYSEAGIPVIEIKNKIFAVVGLGSIGKRVAEIANGFNADVRYWSRNRKEDAEREAIKYEELDKLIQEADFISMNLAQNEETNGIFTKERFASMKGGAVVVNTAPMELVDIDGLVERLEKNDLTFIFDHTDETDEEDLVKLKKFDKCIFYPPMAYISKEAAVNKQEIFIGNMNSFLEGKPQNVVNP